MTRRQSTRSAKRQSYKEIGSDDELIAPEDNPVPFEVKQEDESEEEYTHADSRKRSKVAYPETPRKKRRTRSTATSDSPLASLTSLPASLAPKSDVDPPQDASITSSIRRSSTHLSFDIKVPGKPRTTYTVKVPLEHLSESLAPGASFADPVPLQVDSQRQHKGTSFLDLPAEIRNVVYRLALTSRTQGGVVGKRNYYTSPGWSNSSGALLSVNKQINREAADILYGETKFHFEIDDRLRGRFFDNQWLKVGWEDVYRFFHDIGTHNMSRLRDIQIMFQDYKNSHGRHGSKDRHRFVDNDYVYGILSLLARHGRLDKLSLGMSTGAARLSCKDDQVTKFFRKLMALRADQVTWLGDPDHYIRNTKDRITAEDIATAIIRKKPLYGPRTFKNPKSKQSPRKRVWRGAVKPERDVPYPPGTWSSDSDLP